MGTVRTPLESEISPDYLTGYEDAEEGSTCEFYRHYKKRLEWPGWKLKSSAVMYSLSKCCKTFDTLTAQEKTACGNVVQGTAACNKMFIEKAAYAPKVLYCGTRSCSEIDGEPIRPWCMGYIKDRVVGGYSRVEPAADQISPEYLQGYHKEIIGPGRGLCGNRTRYTKNLTHAVWHK